MATRWQQLAQALLSQSPLTQFAREELTRDLASETRGLALYPLSFSRCGHAAALLAAQEGPRRRLVTLSQASDGPPVDRQPVAEFRRENVRVAVLDVDSELMGHLQEVLPWLRARPNPEKLALGLGDRLGLATPAHVRAVEDSSFFPYLALQSPTELAASGRSWQDVMGDALFGLFREGHRRGFGADADQLRTPEDIEAAAAAGFTRFTLDLSGAIAPVAGMDRKELSTRFVQLEQSIAGAENWRKRFLGVGFDLAMGFSRRTIMFDERTFLMTMVQFGPAFELYRQLVEVVQSAMRGRPFEVEVALFGADVQTPAEAHLFLAMEAVERGLPFHAFAPRLAGRFARCVPHKGNHTKLTRNVALHAAIARLADGHQLAIHSGSDKFDVLGAMAEAADGKFYLKTSGTSMVEALRVAAHVDRELLEAVCEGALASLREGSALFDLDIDPGKLAQPHTLEDADLEALYLDSDHGRHLLCETWAQTLGEKSKLRTRLLGLLQRNEERHFRLVKDHMRRHLLAMQG
jgi:hypothetical protein